MNDISPIWFFIVIAFAMVLPLVGVIIGAYAVFRTKYAQTGLRFMEPKNVNKNIDAPYSYASDLFPEGEDSTGLGNEMLSEAADRIREQRQRPFGLPTLADHKKDVEGK